MAKLVAVRHTSQKDDEPPGLMSEAYFSRFGKDKGYVLAEQAEQAVAAAASGEDPAAETKPKGR